MLTSELLKKMEKVTQTSYKENKLVNMSKSGKSAYFHHIFVNNLLCVNYLSLHFFQQFRNQHKILRFLIPF